MRVEQRTHYRIINECLIDFQKLNHKGKKIDDIISEIKAALINVQEEKDFIIEVLYHTMLMQEETQNVSFVPFPKSLKTCKAIKTCYSPASSEPRYKTVITDF